MKRTFVILGFNDHDEEWTFLGVEATYEEAEKRASTYEAFGAEPPPDLGFSPRPKNPLDILENIPVAWSGYDHYYIFPCNDVSDKRSARIADNE